MWETEQKCCCSLMQTETPCTQRNTSFITFYGNAPNQVMQSKRTTTSLVFVRVSNVVLLVSVAILLTLSGCYCHPHVASITRLPFEFANHQPHHQTEDPAFRVFYGTGVSLACCTSNYKCSFHSEHQLDWSMKLQTLTQSQLNQITPFQIDDWTLVQWNTVYLAFLRSEKRSVAQISVCLTVRKEESS